MTEKITLSDDALVFGFAYLNNEKCTLSFGGVDAKKEITPRARAALNELIAAGVVVHSDPLDSWPGREHYRGNVHLGPIMKDRNLNPFDTNDDRWSWQIFVNKKEGV